MAVRRSTLLGESSLLQVIDTQVSRVIATLQFTRSSTPFILRPLVRADINNYRNDARCGPLLVRASRSSRLTRRGLSVVDRCSRAFISQKQLSSASKAFSLSAYAYVNSTRCDLNAVVPTLKRRQRVSRRPNRRAYFPTAIQFLTPEFLRISLTVLVANETSQTRARGPGCCAFSRRARRSFLFGSELPVSVSCSISKADRIEWRTSFRIHLGNISGCPEWLSRILLYVVRR